MIRSGSVRSNRFNRLPNNFPARYLLLILCLTGPQAARAQEKVQPKAAVTKPAAAAKPAAYTYVAAPQQPKSPCSSREFAVVPVPNVLGHTLSEAKAYLQAAGLRLGNAVPVSAPGAVGTVLRQDPASKNQIVSGSAVNVWYITQNPSGDNGKISDWVIVPDVRTLPEDRAVETLHGRHLHLIETKKVQTDKVAAGIVLDQAPNPGTKVTPESSVRVSVSFAPPKQYGGGAPAAGGGPDVTRQIEYSLFCQPTATDPAIIGQQISFQCRTVPPVADVQYQFYFGDGPPLSQSDATFAHVYTAPRHYDAHGVAVILGREITSGLIPVDVQDVNLAADLVDPPAKANVGDPVTFTAESHPANALTEYDFIFSDNRHSGFQSARTYRRSFEPKGIYSVMVVARVGQGREARSEFSHFDIVPDSQWPLFAAVSVVVLGGGALLQLRRGRWPFPKPQTSFIPHNDPGEQFLDVKGHLPALEICLRPVISHGEQTIVTSAPTVN